jgi:hypothetical protein
VRGARWSAGPPEFLFGERRDGIDPAVSLGMNARHFSRTLLVVLIAAGAVACAKPEDEKKAAWTCSGSEVPMGEVVRCSQSALVIDESVQIVDTETCEGVEDNPELCTTYTCTAGEANCPPVPTTTPTTTTTTPTSDTGSSTPTSGDATGTTAPSGSDTTGDTTSKPGNGNGNGKGGNGNGPFSDLGGKDQCGYIQDLPYCGAGGYTNPNTDNTPGSTSGGTPGSTSGGTSGGAPAGGACTPSSSRGSSGGASDSPTGSTSQVATVAATGILCADKPFGSPESECGHFGLTPSGKDDNLSGLTTTATQSASVAIVKSGTKGCDKGGSAYRVYTGVSQGDTLETPAGQAISHVTYCTGTPTTAPTGSSTDAPSTAPSTAPAASADSCVTTTVKPQYKCKQDKKGNRTCETIPVCAPGSHASACGACVPDGTKDDCVPPSEGGCWVTGGGFIIGPNITTGAAPDGHDSFGGNAKPMKDGRVQGNWNHVDHGTGNHAKGKPEYIVCRHVDEPGPGGPGAKKGFTMNQVYFGGHAQWRVAADAVWSDGYWFDVVAKDHGEPGSQPSVKNGFMPDTYHFTIRKMDDPEGKVSGAIVYETKETLTGGNIQMHPPNGGHPYTPMTLPSFVAFEP